MNVKGSKNMVLILDRGFLSAIGVSFKKIPDGIFITMKQANSIFNERMYSVTEERNLNKSRSKCIL